MTALLNTVLLVAVFSFPVQADGPRFGNRIDRGLIEYDPITEASGIVASRKNPDVLWIHNDHGNQNHLYAVNSQGKHLGVYVIAGVTNRDWEDIALGPGPREGQHYLYIGDIGDNFAQYKRKYIYRVPEPVVNPHQAPVYTTLSEVEIITFQYPDGNRDAETLLVDPLTKDLYVVSKREQQVSVYRALYPQSTTDTLILDRVASVNLSMDVGVRGWTVGGDISPSGREILMKTYLTIYYWYREPTQQLWEVLGHKPVTVSYVPEPQGEAVCWKADETGYYTVSEEDKGIPAHLYFYPRLSP